LRTAGPCRWSRWPRGVDGSIGVVDQHACRVKAMRHEFRAERVAFAGHIPPVGDEFLENGCRRMAKHTLRAMAAQTLLALYATFSPEAATGQRPAAPHYDPRMGESPLRLMVGPADGLGYYHTKLAARRLVAERRFAEAEPLIEQLVRDYPRDGENWLLLARTKGGLRKHAEAAPAYERAGALLGRDRVGAGYNAAIFYLAAGEEAKAIEALRQDVFRHGGLLRWQLYDWPQFASLREHPEFLEIVGRPQTMGWSRDEGWRRDLEHLYAEIRRVNPEYRHHDLPDALARLYAELRGKIPRLSDEQVLAEMSRMIAVLHQGHTGVWDLSRPGSRIPLMRLPIQMYPFPEGIYIVHADEQHKALVGSRLLAIEGMTAEEALRRVNEVTSVDGEMEYLFRAYYLQDASLLKGLGIIGSPDSARLSIAAPGAAPRDVTVPASRIDNWFKLPPPPSVAPPLFLRNVQRPYWELPLPAHDALYVQVNQVRNDARETLIDFGRRLGMIVWDPASPKNLIIDVRHNNGGDGNLYVELLRSAIAFSSRPGNQLYVLIGRGTYSAAANFVTELDRLADPIFVGEATSECCTLSGDAAWVHLPYSGLEVAISGTRWMLGGPFDARREMSPDVPVQFAASAYFAGQDPALESIYRMITARRTPSGATPGIR
jgi:tetratricopeptide (TPR) repeat protein